MGVGKTYNEMIVRIRDLINKNNEEKEKQRELELIALQAQINPHFLYNTLDAIGWIAKMKKQEDIESLYWHWPSSSGSACTKEISLLQSAKR